MKGWGGESCEEHAEGFSINLRGGERRKSKRGKDVQKKLRGGVGRLQRKSGLVLKR